MAPLGLLGIGERGEIQLIRGGSGALSAGKNRLLCPVEEIGLRAGKVVEMLSISGRKNDGAALSPDRGSSNGG